ncbi:hypothetical protein BDP27DRAFT_1439549 [Rhodocollybia butyracea]|uniref:Uncharacterized protein n=1 Tax=Rhodocollybia butyracea TaxID=206335 RepID=A0A9P5TUY7_9AGAR|nr:hypothetical protein BDP27DRAFT_1439549 [Rhodocollybia butyracea]
MDVDSPSNEIQVSSSPPSTPLKKPMERIHDRLRSSTSLPSSRSRSSLSSSLVTPPGKKMNRQATATDQPFPTDKHAYNMDILQDLAHDYCFHLSLFNRIANEAPIWSNNFATSLYKLILTQSNKEFLLDIEADDLTEVDVKGLEADVIRDSSPLPSSSPPQLSPRS